MTRKPVYTSTMTITKGTLTPGIWVEGTYTLTRLKDGAVASSGTWSGWFDTTRPSDWDPKETVHLFKGGHIGSTPQGDGLHGFPVGQLTNPEGVAVEEEPAEWPTVETLVEAGKSVVQADLLEGEAPDLEDVLELVDQLFPEPGEAPLEAFHARAVAIMDKAKVELEKYLESLPNA